MAAETYHPGIVHSSRSTKRTASIILSSRAISLSDLNGYEKGKNKKRKFQKQKQKQQYKKEEEELKIDVEEVVEEDEEEEEEEEENYEYDDNDDDDTFSINSEQSFFFHPKNYFNSSINKGIGTKRGLNNNNGRIERSTSIRSIGDSSVAATIDELELLPNMDELLNYSREKELGVGADSNVYEVVDRRRSHVAMKLTKRKSGRYRTEIHLLHQLRTCPYIVKLLKVLEDPNVYVLILEQAPMTLETLLHEGCVENPMQEGVAKDIMLNLSKGIRAIHNLGFVHKDIKPEDAFKMDVFSAGVCLYRMICNEMPFGLFETWDIKR